MGGFTSKHPIIFGAILFFVALVAAALITSVLVALGFSSEVAAALARIVIGCVVLAIFAGSIAWSVSLSGLRWALPALLVAAWNIALELLAGNALISGGEIAGAVLLGIAPAIFEEAIFRGAVIGKLREGGKGAWYSLWASALLFSAVHLTNIVGMSAANIAVQVIYSLVIGLFLGAVYLKTSDIVSVIIAHAVIDTSNHLFVGPDLEATAPLFIAFAVVLAVVAGYSLWLAHSIKE